MTQKFCNILEFGILEFGICLFADHVTKAFKLWKKLTVVHIIMVAGALTSVLVHYV